MSPFGIDRDATSSASTRSRTRILLGAATAAAILALTTACAHASSPSNTPVADTGGSGSAASSGAPADSLRLGYFANVTHTTPIVGVAKNFFADKLGSTKLSTQVFNAGPDEMTALLGGKLDAAYVGPSSALNAFVKSKGGLTIVAGAQNAGAELVVSSKINSITDLKGKTLATPQLGNTQDVALRYWLKQQGYATNQQGAGDVKISPTDNATSLTLFEADKIDGAWVPEPWASRLVVEGKGHVLVDEKTLWPGGQFATTNLVVASSYLRAHPQAVKELIEGQIDANAWVTANPAAAATLVNSTIKTLTGKALKDAVITRAWGEENVTNDPEAASLQTSLAHAVSDGLLKQSPLNGIFDLSLLNQALAAAGQPTVSSAGLGNQ